MSAEKIAAPLRRAAGSGDVPGAAATAATADGVVFEGAFGTRGLGTDAPMTADTVVWIASMTKAITAACAMQLVERGQLTLDGDLAAVLPELGRVQVLDGFDADGKPKLRPQRGAITLRHLLTHPSGFGYDMWSADLVRYQEATSTPGIISCANKALTTPLLFDPGSAWNYGISLDLAGKAVEAASGQRLGAYMQANIFDPLGMTDTAFSIGPAQLQRLSKMHARTPDGLAAIEFMVPQEPEFDMGGGGLYGTVRDYLKFTQMILHGGTFNGAQVLRPETVALMSRNAMGDVSCRPMHSAIAFATNDVPFLDGMKWGLSFVINPEPLPTGRSAGSLAWAGLANSYYWIDPVKQVTGVFATQILPFFDPQTVRALTEFETAVYASLGRS